MKPVVRQTNFYSATRIPGSGGRAAPCRVYWGSHGCMLERGHEGGHFCTCTYGEDGEMLPHASELGDNGNVGRAPYYGPETCFYGEDAETLGLPLVKDR